jgi:dTDP-glucose 4,6-dehydratase
MNIGSPEELTVLQLAELIRSLAGSSSEISFTGRPVDDPNVRCPDISVAREVLGWEPKVALDAGLRTTISWARGRGRS